jgi:hypothetical protein
MPEYILPIDDRKNWNSLDAFTQGYIEAIFFTNVEPGTTAETHEPETQSSLPGDASFDDLSEEAVAEIKRECAEFQARYAAEIAKAIEIGKDYDDAAAGRDFWYTRCGHGVGFWGRDLGEIGDKLTAACGFRTEFPDRSVYLGDDGRIYYGQG